MIYSENSLPIDSLSFEIKQRTSQRFLAELIVKPSVLFFNFKSVHPADVVDSDCLLELFPSLSSFLKEVGTKPNLLHMSFMRIFT